MYRLLKILGNPDVFWGDFCCDSCVHNIHATKIDRVCLYKLNGILLHCSLYASHQKIDFCAVNVMYRLLKILGNPDVFWGDFCCDSCVHNIHATKIDRVCLYKLNGILLHCSLYASHQKIDFCAASRKKCLDVFAAHFITFSKKLIRWPAVGNENRKPD